ncbi:MAG: fibronectin type III domain-containing protein [Nitrospirota bacterium]
MATVPAGLLPGTYNLHLSNLDGKSAILHNAFTVKKGAANISVSPVSYNFGDINVGSSSSHTFTVSNTGTTDLIINAINISGTDSSQFNRQNDNCSGQTLSSLSSCTVQAVFNPTLAGLKSANLSIPYTLLPPSTPSGLTATTVSSSQINLSWTDNSNNEVGFKIERKVGVSGIYSQIATVGANITTYSDTGLTPGTIYYYRVRAYNEGGDSNYSNEASATTLPLPPTSPSGLTATAVSSIQINLSWTDNSNNETGFKIERKEGVSGIYSQIATVGTNITTYPDIGLTPGTIYYYRVRAYNEGGDSNYSNEANATTLPLPPTSPSGLTATTISSIQVNLSWADTSNNETGFKIERKEEVSGTYSQIATVGTNVTIYSDRGLTANTTYYYRVRAYNDAGDSNYSNEANATTLPPSTNITLNITSPLDGSIVYRPDVMVTGTITNTTGNETGVTVNGIVATVYSNQFVANHVPLVEGSNTITAIATDTTGDAALTSITVNAVTTTPYITLTANIEAGIAPLTTYFSVSTSIPNAVSSYQMDYEGDGTNDYTGATFENIGVTYPAEGIYYPTVRVIDSEGITYSDTIAIVVLNKDQLDTLLKAKWNVMKIALINRDIEGAVSYFSANSQDVYREQFTDLSSVLDVIGNELGQIQLVNIENNRAEYEIIVTRNDITYSFHLLFVNDLDGLWKIGRF